MRRALLNAEHSSAFACFEAGFNLVKSSVKFSLAAVALVATLGAAQVAKADSYNFTITSGTGITASGMLQTADTGPLGAQTITGISGTFTDLANGISGAITGVEFAPPPTFNAPPAPPNTFGAPAFTDAGFSYDDLFWADGDSPAVCAEALMFSGGDFDIYGMAFTIAGGYTADLWSNGSSFGGYQLNDSLNGVPFTPSNMDGLAYAVDFNATAAPTPEPGSFVLLATGLSSLTAFGFRRRLKA